MFIFLIERLTLSGVDIQKLDRITSRLFLPKSSPSRTIIDKFGALKCLWMKKKCLHIFNSSMEAHALFLQNLNISKKMPYFNQRGSQNQYGAWKFFKYLLFQRRDSFNSLILYSPRYQITKTWGTKQMYIYKLNTDILFI